MWSHDETRSRFSKLVWIYLKINRDCCYIVSVQDLHAYGCHLTFTHNPIYIVVFHYILPMYFILLLYFILFYLYMTSALTAELTCFLIQHISLYR